MNSKKIALIEFSCDKSVILKTQHQTPRFSSDFCPQFQDEARHGKAFDGLLNRYFK